MTDPEQNNSMHDLVKRSKIYQEYCLKRDQILRYKWIESERIGQDIGLDKAWIQWEAKYYRKWKKSLSTNYPKTQPTGTENDPPANPGKRTT